MAFKEVILAAGLIVTAVPLSATVQDEVPAAGAPAGGPETRYCMRIEAPVGTRLEELKCWTRAEWAEHDVDVDMDWAREGVRAIG